MLKRITITFMLLFIAARIWGQTDTATVSHVEVEMVPFEELMKMGIDVASFHEKNIFNTPSTVSVIDAESIKRYNFISISEALNTVAGFSVMRTYIKRNIPVSRGILQDHYANKVLVMINNVPAWNGNTGEGNLDRININDVERIEVLKGPASVLYGTNAYSGAVNIVLKKAHGSNLNSYFRTGERGMIQGGGNISVSNDDFSLFVSANSSTEKGKDFFYTDQANISGNLGQYMKASNFTLNLGYKDHSFLFNTYNVDESYLGVSNLFSTGAGKNHNLQGYLANYSFKSKLSRDLQFNSKFTFDWNQRILSRSFDDNTRANVTGQRLNGLVNFVYSPSENFSLQVGSEYGLKQSIKYINFTIQKDLVLEENNMANKSVYDFALFGQADYVFSSFDLLFGLRYNKNELFGGNVSTRGTLVYQLNDKNSVKLVYGTSYRSPSLFELYFQPSTNTVFGNTNLKPEESTSFELSYLTSFNNFFVQALVYYAKYANKIFRTLGTVVLPNGTVKNNVSIYTNGNKFTAKGVELEAKYHVTSSFDAFANFSYVKGDRGDEVNSNGQYNFKYIAENTLVLGFSKKFGNLSFSGIANYLSEQNGPKSIIGGQTTFDGNISFNHKLQGLTLQHNISLKNIFDKTVYFPEFVNRVINAVPSGYGRVIFYSLSVML